MFEFEVDRKRPTMTIYSPDMRGDLSDDPHLTIRQTFRILFVTDDHTIRDFNLSDVNCSSSTMFDVVNLSRIDSHTFEAYVVQNIMALNSVHYIHIDESAFQDEVAHLSERSNIFSWRYILDKTAPTVTISSSDVSDGSSSMDTTFQFTFNTSEITTDFAIEDVHVLGGVLMSFTGSGTSYSATFISSAEGGLRQVRVDAAVFTDSAGNTNLPSNDFNFTYVASDITSAYGWVQRGSTIYGTNDGCTFFHLKYVRLSTPTFYSHTIYSRRAFLHVLGRKCICKCTSGIFYSIHMERK